MSSTFSRSLAVMGHGHSMLRSTLPIIRSARFASSQTPQQRATARSGTVPSATKAPEAKAVAPARPALSSGRPALRSSWPWRPASPASPAPPAGFAEEERLIYARPYEGPMGRRVKMLWFLFPFGGLIIGMYVSTPKLKRRGEKDEDMKDVPEGAWAVDEETPWYWHLDNIAVITVATSLCVIWTFLPTRFVTRLALVKRYPVPSSSAATAPAVAPGQVTEFLRMQHGGHLMALTENAPMRDLSLNDVTIKAIGRPGDTSFLNLKIHSGGKKNRLSLDGMGYRLDFRDTKLIKNTDEEVVLSLNRLEHVFGNMRK